MAYFAKLGIGNIVEKVESVADSIATTEQKGIDFLNNLFKTNDIWKETFIDGSERQNFAGIGYKYNESKNVFIAPRPFYSWVLNESNYSWEAPVAYPDDDKRYKWNETTEQWVLDE